jgi:hypothetical protein
MPTQQSDLHHAAGLPTSLLWYRQQLTLSIFADQSMLKSLLDGVLSRAHILHSGLLPTRLAFVFLGDIEQPFRAIVTPVQYDIFDGVSKVVRQIFIEYPVALH